MDYPYSTEKHVGDHPNDDRSCLYVQIWRKGNFCHKFRAVFLGEYKSANTSLDDNQRTSADSHSPQRQVVVYKSFPQLGTVDDRLVRHLTSSQVLVGGMRMRLSAVFLFLGCWQLLMLCSAESQVGMTTVSVRFFTNDGGYSTNVSAWFVRF